MTDQLPRQKASIAKAILRIVGWTFAILLALIVTGAVALFISAEIDAATHCAKATYHSAECKDIRTLQAAMIVFGGPAAVGLGILVFLLRRARKTDNRTHRCNRM